MGLAQRSDLIMCVCVCVCVWHRADSTQVVTIVHGHTLMQGKKESSVTKLCSAAHSAPHRESLCGLQTSTYI